MKEFFNDKVFPAIMNVITSRPLTAVKDGMIATISLTIIGSIFLLLANFPYLPIQQFFIDMGVKDHMMQVYRATFNLISVIAVFAVAYNYAKNAGKEGLGAGILAVITFMILIPHTVTASGATDTLTIANVFPMGYTGSKGLISALIIGALTGMEYDYFLTKGFTIKMPEGVPPNIANSFAALIPGTVLFTIAFAVNVFFVNFMGSTAVDFIYKAIQTPLMGFSDSLVGVIVFSTMVSLLWWFGVHGASLVGGITSGIVTANMLANQAILDSGLALTAENGAAVYTTQVDAMWRITGSGITFGVVIAFLFFAKSNQFKTLGKLAAPSALFNINEPILFGTPIVLNPKLFLPFIYVPVVAAVAAYLAIDLGLVPYYGAVSVPWTTPPIISGLITGGWRAALLQAAIIAWSIVGYYPWIKKLDDETYAEELAKEAAIEAAK